MITLSQSGETADTLAGLRLSKELGYLGSLAICNVPVSSDRTRIRSGADDQRGTEIGVASTKAFTTQLTVLLMLQWYEAVSASEGLTIPLNGDIGHGQKAPGSKLRQMLSSQNKRIDAGQKDFS